MKFTQLIFNENNSYNFTNDFNLNIDKIKKDGNFKYLNEGASRKVYLNTSSNTVFKIAINKEGIIQNLNEFNLSKSFSLIFPIILNSFKFENNIVVIESEFISKTFNENNWNENCLKYLNMSNKIWMILLNNLKHEDFNSEKFFDLITTKHKSDFKFESKNQFNLFCNSKWFKNLQNFIIKFNPFTNEFSGENLGLNNKNNIVILDSGKL